MLQHTTEEVLEMRKIGIELVNHHLVLCVHFCNSAAVL